LPAPSFLDMLGFRGGIRVIRLGGFLLFYGTPPLVPQREAGEEIPPRRIAGEGISLCRFPRDRPDPMEEPAPQDDDPNSSTLNPLSFPLPLPAAFCAKGSFRENCGWARIAALYFLGLEIFFIVARGQDRESRAGSAGGQPPDHSSDGFEVHASPAAGGKGLSSGES
jgi:hypothetical protein